MFKNYLKMTFAVMRRRKFFTFISLFGITFTLLILTVATAFYEHLFSGNYPEPRRELCLYANRLVEKDTEKNSTSMGPMSLSFVKKFFLPLKTPEKISFFTQPNTINTYGNGKKLKLYFKYTDANFWEITQFEFLEGRPFTQREIDQNEAVAVINDATRDDYFGKGVPAEGKTFELNGQSLRIIGVVRGCPITRMFIASDVYMPYNLQKEVAGREGYNGNYSVMVLAANKSDLPKIQAEYAEVVSRIPIMKRGDFTPDVIKSRLSSYFDCMVLENILNADDSAAVWRFYGILTLLVLLFMSLPAINLVNINISRILERASEIGIRKAFGASARTLVAQFVVENVIITLIGGLLSIVLSALFIYWFNRSGFIAYADLAIDWKVLFAALLLSLLFGLLSGVYPAWRMSKLPIVEALKG